MSTETVVSRIADELRGKPEQLELEMILAALRERVTTGQALLAVSDGATPEAGLWDADQFAAYLNCSKRHVYRMADAGICPPGFKLLGLRRWLRSACVRWVEAGCPNYRESVGG